MSTEVRFYKVKDPYGELSNFAPYPIVVDEVRWPTSEHYFQAQKFAGHPTSMERVRGAPTPGDAARLGRGLPGLRGDWEEVKDDAMRRALLAKFTQHAKLKRKLLATGDATLIEHTRNDRYWADGGDGTGLNRLGVLLMELRSRLHEEERNRQ